MNESIVLKWVANADMDLPQYNWVSTRSHFQQFGIDKDKLLNLIQRHRLEQRFLRRFQQQHPKWCNKTLLTGILAQCVQAAASTQRQIDAIQEISRQVTQSSPSFTLIKGVSTYALTSDAIHIHRSVDLDIFAAEPGYLWEVMEDLGYRGQKTLDCQHEYAILSRGDITFEIHRFLPIAAYPPNLLNCSFLPS